MEDFKSPQQKIAELFFRVQDSLSKEVLEIVLFLLNYPDTADISLIVLDKKHSVFRHKAIVDDIEMLKQFLENQYVMCTEGFQYEDQH